MRWTDEDLFRALPPSACSVRVGVATTTARFFLGNHGAVRRMLGELLAPKREDPNPSKLPTSHKSLRETVGVTIFDA